MTADRAREVEGQYGRIEAQGDKHNYPVTLYGTVVKVDSYWLYFNVMDEEPALFSLRKIKEFTPMVRRHRLPKLPRRHLKTKML